MLTLDRIRKDVLQALESYFPSAKVESKERRGVIFELRAHISEDAFIEVYANAVAGKKSFALISKGCRVTGYDNYKFWHHHPPDAPNEHRPCGEPSVDSVISNFRELL